MTIFEEIEALYLAIDNTYAVDERNARFRNHTKKEANIARKRSLNDQAYFLFMFTRLEEKIRDLSDKRISDRIKKVGNRRNRRTWEILQNTGNRLNLLDRVSVSLLTIFNGADYQLIQRYKKQRDTIAQGGTVPINISIVLSDFKRLYTQLK